MAIATASTLIVNSRGASTFQWVNAASLTVSDQTTGMVGIDNFNQATLYLKVTAISNTSADFYIQKLLGDGLTWQDLAHYTQFTGTGNRVLHLISGGNLEEAQQSAAMAGTTKTAAFGGIWRLNVLIVGAGTTTFSLWAEMLA